MMIYPSIHSLHSQVWFLALMWSETPRMNDERMNCPFYSTITKENTRDAEVNHDPYESAKR